VLKESEQIHIINLSNSTVEQSTDHSEIKFSWYSLCGLNQKTFVLA